MKSEQLQEYLDYAGSMTVPDVHLDTSGLHAFDQLFDALGVVEKGSSDHGQCRKRVWDAYDEAVKIVKESKVHVDRFSRTGLLLEAASQYLGEGLEGDPSELLKIIHRPLLPLEDILSSGKVPTTAELMPLVEAELRRNSLWIQVHPGPDTHHLALAACFLNDAELFHKAVREDYLADSSSYRGQKNGGMSEEDLGPEPTESLSALRLTAYVEQNLDKLPAAIRSDALAHLNEF